MALTPLAQAQSLAARPELDRLGPAKLTQDPGSFKTMLTSQMGVSNQVFGSKPPSLVSPLANIPGLLARQEGGKGLYAPSSGSQGQSQGQAASALSGPVVRGRVTALAHDAQSLQQPGSPARARSASETGIPSATPSGVHAGTHSGNQPGARAGTQAGTQADARAGAQAGDAGSGQAAAAQQARSRPHQVRGQVLKPAEKVDPEKDDLGHLPGPGSKGSLPQCFTKD